MDNKNNNNSNTDSKNITRLKNGLAKVEKVNLDIQNTANQLSGLANNGQQLAGTLSDVQKMHFESQKLKAQTHVELERIDKQYDTINKHIDTEYSKQSRAMDKSEEVIDKGLAEGNLDYIREGLNSMVNVANHNPMADLKKTLDKQIENFDDDDFTIEI
ncbi:hypothetical protein [Tenacibaculum piscium]|uniref:Uncharacterized protein n=1 Tax=Tenacibaculum piscium TaxID=1458515 RepID=A0A2H1YIG4_9FLAO|nr:hypothetical protein [Tenacibaculum piscium]MBE7628497.1 hypothetical protein [Tenacibaculum piscium]MBE7669637.1 hypothetical protein [Tenacibaculum piscium]SOS75285.1 conserved hypothetical protein [Tenacibaculum piscium]